MAKPDIKFPSNFEAPKPIAKPGTADNAKTAFVGTPKERSRLYSKTIHITVDDALQTGLTKFLI